MTDRIDTDVTRGNIEQLRGCADADLGSHDVRWCLSVMDRLCDEVDRLRALADPAPVGLTEDEQRRLAIAHAIRDEGDTISPDFVDDMLAIIDRLSAAPVDDRERVPEGWRVEWTPTPELEFDPPADVPRLVRK